MRYFILNKTDKEEINIFKRYRCINLDTLHIETIGGKSLLHSKVKIATSRSFKSLDFSKGNFEVRIKNKLLQVYEKGMSYVINDIDIDYVYIEGSIVHIGVKDFGHEIIIDTYMGKMRGYGFKSIIYSGNSIREGIPNRMQISLGLIKYYKDKRSVV